MWIDITKTINKDFPAWPGDISFTYKSKHISDLMSSHFCCSSHAGTHIDAPLHWIKNGKRICEIPINDLCGIVQVIHTKNKNITKEDTEKIICDKVFFKTGFYTTKTFKNEYPYINEESAKILVNKKTKLIGTDCMSVESYKEKNGKIHKILLSNNIIIVESLNLENIIEGLYDFFVLPIKTELEASPARAIIRPFVP